MATTTKQKTIPRKKKIVRNNLSALERDILTLDGLRIQREDIDQEIINVQQRVLARLEEKGESTVTVKTKDRHIIATRVQQVREAIDPVVLKKKVGAKMWDRITTKVLDKKKLEAFIASGEIDALAIADAVKENVANPFLRLTRK